MNLRWNQELHRFEAELGSGGFRADLEAVKSAGFKCDGPPTWVWHSGSSLPLKWLRENRPPILTIEANARTEYERMLPLDEANAKVKAEAKAEKKAARKKKVKEQHQAELVQIHIPEKGYIGAEDLPPMPPMEHPFVRPLPPNTKCFVCNAPVYEYEYAPGAPPACLWCQKTVLDIDSVV